MEPLANKVFQAKRQGKTQREIAQDMGVTEQHLSNVLTGRAKPSMDFICKACEAFNCNIEDICTFEKGD